MLVSQDGVAIDSVGFDFLNAEWGMPQNTDYYLHEAAYVPGANGLKRSGVAYRPNAGSSAFVGSLGTQEHWNNSTNKQYSRNLGSGNGIELVKLMPGVPSVTLVGPGAGPFTAGMDLLLQAVVINNTNPISQVAFYQGTQTLGTSSGTYCGISWSNVAQGNYVLKAVATDSSGLSCTSSPVNITVVAAPTNITCFVSANEFNDLLARRSPGLDADDSDEQPGARFELKHQRLVANLRQPDQYAGYDLARREQGSRFLPPGVSVKCKSSGQRSVQARARKANSFVQPSAFDMLASASPIRVGVSLDLLALHHHGYRPVWDRQGILHHPRQMPEFQTKMQGKKVRAGSHRESRCSI